MSLTACPECSRQISTAAFACPGCGYPRPTLDAVPRRRIDWLVPAIAAGGLLASMVGMSVMRSAMHARHAAEATHVELIRTLEVHHIDAPLPPTPPMVEFLVDRSVEASAPEAPQRIFNP